MKNRKGFIIWLLAMFLLMSSCAASRSSRALRKAERQMEKAEKRSKKEFKQAKSAHYKHQAKKTKRMIKRDKRHAERMRRRQRSNPYFSFMDSEPRDLGFVPCPVSNHIVALYINKV